MCISQNQSANKSAAFFVIAGVGLLLLVWYLSTLPEKQRNAAIIKRNWGNALNAVTASADIVLADANRHQKLPFNINDLPLPKDCHDTLYLLKDDAPAVAIVAYPIDGTPSNHEAPSFYFFELRVSAPAGTPQKFVKGGMKIANWRDFLGLLSGSGWSLQVVR